MANYLVTGDVLVDFEFEIEADSLAEAEEKAIARALEEVEGASRINFVSGQLDINNQ